MLGDAAVYIDPLDIRAIVSAMQELLEDDTKRDRFARLGLQRAAQFGPARTGIAMRQALAHFLVHLDKRHEAAEQSAAMGQEIG